MQKVLAPGRETVSWTVVDERFEPVAPVEAYLAHLEAVERSPNTVRAYASSLRLFFEFLGTRGTGWDKVGLDELGRFASWLRRPSPRGGDPDRRSGVWAGGVDGEPSPCRRVQFL